MMMIVTMLCLSGPLVLYPLSFNLCTHRNDMDVCVYNRCGPLALKGARDALINLVVFLFGGGLFSSELDGRR